MTSLLPIKNIPVPEEIKDKLEEYGDDFKLLYEELYDLVVSQRIHNILAAHRIGKVMVYVLEEYRKEGVKLLSKALNLDSTFVRDAIFFAQKYPDQKEVEKLIKNALKTNPTFSWSHIRLLLSVEQTALPEDEEEAKNKKASKSDSDSDREQISAEEAQQISEQLQERVISDGLSVRELREEIRREVGRKRRPGAGRPSKPAVAGSLSGCLEQLEIMANKWVDHGIKVFGDENESSGLLDKLIDTCVDDDDIYEAGERLRSISETYRNMASRAMFQANRCLELINRIDEYQQEEVEEEAAYQEE